MADTIREYLVSLGFSVDQAKLHSFQDAIHGTARSVGSLGAEVAGAGFALTEMVERVARHFEDLYYMSQRTGATVAGLDAIGFAAKQVGLSTEQAQGMVENFASSLRMNPGLRGMLGGLGVGGNGPQEQAENLVARLKRQFGEGGYFVAARMAGMFGVEERTFQHLWMNLDRLRAEEGDHRRRMKEAGLDADVEAEKFTDFGRVLNRVEDNFSILGIRIAKDWRDPVQGMLGSLDSLIERFNRADDASAGIIGRVSGLLAAFGGVTAVLAILGRMFGFKAAGTLAAAVGGGGVLGGAAEILGTIQSDSQNGNQLRTGLRALLGIDDPHEGGVGAMGDAFGLGQHRRTRPWGDPSDAAPYPSRPPVGKSSKVWGDQEAIDAGLYEGTPLPRPRPSSAGPGGITVTQTNNISGSFKDADEIARRVGETNRDLGNALRNLYPKVQ